METSIGMAATRRFFWGCWEPGRLETEYGPCLHETQNLSRKLGKFIYHITRQFLCSSLGCPESQGLLVKSRCSRLWCLRDFDILVQQIWVDHGGREEWGLVILSKGNNSQQVLRTKDVTGKCVRRVAGKKAKGGVHFLVFVYTARCVARWKGLFVLPG